MAHGIEVTVACPDCGHEFEARVLPGRPASRRGHPDTWTPPDPPEVDNPFCPACGEEVDHEAVYEAVNVRAGQLADEAAGQRFQEIKERWKN